MLADTIGMPVPGQFTCQAQFLEGTIVVPHKIMIPDTIVVPDAIGVPHKIMMPDTIV